jgi:hypothetical protein
MKATREILLKEKSLVTEVEQFRNRFRNILDQSAESPETKPWKDFTMDLFRFQARANPVYRRFVELMGVEPSAVNSVEEVPFLPVELYQKQRISVFQNSESDVHCFASSGTTGSSPSLHPVDDLDWYDEVAFEGFAQLVINWNERPMFIGLLPGYLERNNSSLVHMVQSFMIKADQSNPEDWFFLREFEALEKELTQLFETGFPHDRPIYIIGVTHALLAWVERLKRESQSPAWLGLSIRVIETGGMKGQGKERIRMELHDELSLLTRGRPVGSEYGMTELLSQAWSTGDGRFECPPWMEVRMGALNDPRGWAEEGKQGRIHVVDLANVSTCAFIATSDIGRRFKDGSFEVLGRYDFAEVRGCNLMAID